MKRKRIFGNTRLTMNITRKRNQKKKAEKTFFSKLTNIFEKWRGIISLIMVITTLLSVKFASDAAFYSSESAKFSEETVEWYEDPKPLICLESSAFYQILDKGYISIYEGGGYNYSLGVKSNIYSHTTLTLSFYNAGRIPAGSGNIMIDIINSKVSNESDIDSPFPFKILSLITPADGFQYNKSQESFIHLYPKQAFSYGRWYHKNNVLDFPPVININDIVQLDRDYKIGTIYPEQEINVTLELFSTRDNATADLQISIKYLGKSIEEITTQNWIIPLVSLFS